MNHTPTPWKVRTMSNSGDCFVEGNNVVGSTLAGDYRREIMSDEMYDEKPADAAFLVEACNNYDRLTEENKRLREALKSVVAALTQNHTYPADITYAINIARTALGEEER